jgi:hypothetical protein
MQLIFATLLTASALSAVSLAKSGTLSNIQESEIDESVQTEISEPIGKYLSLLTKVDSRTVLLHHRKHKRHSTRHQLKVILNQNKKVHRLVESILKDDIVSGGQQPYVTGYPSFQPPNGAGAPGGQPPYGTGAPGPVNQPYWPGQPPVIQQYQPGQDPHQNYEPLLSNPTGKYLIYHISKRLQW